jgi:hypothetical protein
VAASDHQAAETVLSGAIINDHAPVHRASPSMRSSRVIDTATVGRPPRWRPALDASLVMHSSIALESA